MLIGEFTHVLDSKKRISLPVKFRKELGKKLVVTHGLDNCLFVYSLIEWKQIALKISQLGLGQSDSRGFNRFMLAGAIEVDIDSGGRILIPDFLKEFAKLSSKVVLAGVYNRLEIWDEKTWTTYKKQIQGKADQLAEKLSDINAL
jgi:MraZ protein